MAAFLSGIFSRLGFIDTSWPNQRHAYYPGHEEVEDDTDEAVGPDCEWWQKSHLYGKRWKVVQRQFDLFARVRMEERRRRVQCAECP